MSSLEQLLHFRYPVIWITTNESERLIVSLTTLMKDDERDVYVFDDFSGLSIWDRQAEDYKIILQDVIHPGTGEEMSVPITKFEDAFQYCYDQDSSAVFAIRNFHLANKDDSFSNPLASLFAKYYRGFRFDDLGSLPLTVVCISTQEDIPDELSGICVKYEFSRPSESAIVSTLGYIAAKSPIEDAFEEGQMTQMAKACRGMTEFEVVSTVFDLIKRDGKVSAEEIEKLKYERLKASSNLDIIKPRWSLAEVGGLDVAKELINKADWIRRNPEEAKAKGIQPINKFLLLGISGCGKSMVCEAAAKTLGLDLANVGVSKVMSKWIGESERQIREMFYQLHALAPICVWVDELGRDFRGGDFDGGTTSRVHGELLTGLQNLPSDVALFGAANDISSLAPEMLRAGRFDKILFVGFPSYEERLDILKLNLGADSNHNWDELAHKTEFYTGAEIVQLVSTARFDNMFAKDDLTTENIVHTMAKLKNRIWVRHRNLARAMYREAYEQHEWASSQQYEEAKAIIDGVSPQSSRSASQGVRVKF